MSQTRHRSARLSGFSGPYFPFELDALTNGLEGMNGVELGQLGERVPGFLGLDRPTTSDGYFWFWAFNISVGSGRVAVLVPWRQDDSTDPWSPDRSMAVYTRRVLWGQRRAMAALAVALLNAQLTTKD